MVMKQHLKNSILVTIGFILSPLSWWNDLVVNVPLGYAFAWPFSLINEQLFLPAFILGYWLTNLLGFLLLHWGSEGLLYQSRSTISIRRSLVVSVIYSVIVMLMVLFGWIASPTEYLD
ncbi:hypothetical protein [Candidatus Endoriftia persephone]|jgi:hypothetical protein|uniref:Uncharacterized protein n=1 Tax=Candidatus Endoriftia persephonae TaxID=393765 RepID=A0A9J7A395_9GAMM|nr:hypothetical protein [Candidatus Endoriftia persephone]USF89088.1 hypothetical protein L0Y14_07625 [Candidatus Endoriftia persephone]